jgi:hypothetical protein
VPIVARRPYRQLETWAPSGALRGRARLILCGADRARGHARLWAPRQLRGGPQIYGGGEHLWSGGRRQTCPSISRGGVAWTSNSSQSRAREGVPGGAETLKSFDAKAQGVSRAVCSERGGAGASAFPPIDWPHLFQHLGDEHGGRAACRTLRRGVNEGATCRFQQAISVKRA